MPVGKPLSERNDFYSKKQKAMKDILRWLDEGASENKIILQLGLRYGFGKHFLNQVKEMLKNE